MKNKYLIKELKERIDKTRYSDSFKWQLFNSHLIEKMRVDLLNNLICASDYDFNMYLSFLFKFSKAKKGYLNYETKLGIISNYLILKAGIINTSELINLLVNTDLIENNDICRFSYNFLNIKESEQLIAITDILYSLNGHLRKINLRYIFGLAKKVDDPETLFRIVHLFEKNVINNDRNFNAYLRLIYENVDNYNLDFFMRLLYIREVRAVPNIKDLLKKYILNINNNHVNMEDIDTKDEILLAIFKNLDMLESRYLEPILDFVNSCDTSYYEIIKKLINNKNMFKDRNFYILFQTLKATKTKSRRKFLMAILKNPRIINNEFEMKAGLKFLKKTNDENKLVAFFKIFIVGPLKNDSLYTQFSMLIQNSLLKCKTKEQILSLVKLVPTLKTSTFKNDILKIILNSNNNYALEIYPELLKIPYVKEDGKTLDLMKKLNNLENECQLVLIKKLASEEKIFKRNNFMYLVEEVLKKRNIKILFPLAYIDLFKDPFISNILKDNFDNVFISLWDIALDIKSSDQYNFLINIFRYPKLLLNNKNIEIIREFILKTNKCYKFKGLMQYINENNIINGFSLDSERSKTIIMLIKTCKEEYQVQTLLQVSKLVKNSREEANLLVKASHISNEKKGNELISLLKVPNILKNPKFKEILYHYETSENSMQKYGMLKLLEIKELMKSDYFIGYLMIIKRLKTLPQIGALLKVLNEYSDLKDYELFDYCKKIMFITDPAKLILVGELIIASKRIPSELTNVVIEKIALCNPDNMIAITEYVGNLITKYQEQESIEVEDLLKDLKVSNKTLRKK